MSVGETKVHVVMVSGAEAGGELTKKLLSKAGYPVSGKAAVSAHAGTIRRAVIAAFANADVVVVVGGIGMFGDGPTVGALAGLLDRRLAGFADVLRMACFAEQGGSAVSVHGVAGLSGATVCAAIPGERGVAGPAVKQVLASQLVEWADSVDVTALRTAARDSSPDEDTNDSDDKTSSEAGEAVSSRRFGWRSGMKELGGKMMDLGVRVPVPERLLSIAPVQNVLHTAGQVGAMEREDGQTFALYGFPDLRNPSSKVLAVGEGDPIASIFALHRHPVPTGICTDGEGLWVPGREQSLDEVCESVTGEFPPDGSGQLFAVQGDAVFIQRDDRVFRWDGRRESNEGTVKQAFASLALHWCRR